MNYSGDQGQQIRQLISAHMLRRVAMCVMASPPSGGGGGSGATGRRQHLAVSHEKGKITILQLSALLKQADSSKKKLTLTRLHSAPVPFTALSIASNPCSDDVLAVSGLKDCHVLVFAANGSVDDHIVLHPALETGNFIIKSMWLPGSQSELAVVTADFVKIYDLATDALSPQYYFLLPTGKIRDASVAYPPSSTEGDAPPTILLMTSSGYVYSQGLEEASSARHGPFYVSGKESDALDGMRKVWLLFTPFSLSVSLADARTFIPCTHPLHARTRSRSRSHARTRNNRTRNTRTRLPFRLRTCWRRLRTKSSVRKRWKAAASRCTTPTPCSCSSSASPAVNPSRRRWTSPPLHWPPSFPSPSRRRRPPRPPPPLTTTRATVAVPASDSSLRSSRSSDGAKCRAIPVSSLVSRRCLGVVDTFPEGDDR